MSGARALRHVTTPTPAAAAEPQVISAGLTRHQRAHLADGLRRRAQLTMLDTFAELEALLPTTNAFDVAVLSPHDATGRDSVALVELITRSWPGAAIVIFCPASPLSHSRSSPHPPTRSPSPPPLRALVLAGAHQIVFEGVHDTTAAVAAAVNNARRESAAEQVLAQLQPHVPVRLHSLVHVVLADPELTAVATVANALGIHRKTLVNRCAQSRFLSPGQVIAWTRLAMVGYLLGRTGLTIEAISLSLGFPSHTSLRNLIKRYTGRTATEIREAGGLPAVIAAFQRKLPIT